MQHPLGAKLGDFRFRPSRASGQTEIARSWFDKLTSEAFTGLLLEQGIQVSMDGKGRYQDNIFVERLWRSVKYEEVYLKAYQTVAEARPSGSVPC